MRNEDVQWFSRSGLGPDPVAMHGAPVTFSAGVGGIGAGEDMVLDTSALQSGYRMPYYLDEIRMQVFSDPATFAGSYDPYSQFAAQQVLSYAMGFQFRAGPYAFSQNPIPMGLYAPNYNGRALGEVYSNGTARGGSDVRLILAKPLFMAPGDVVQARVARAVTPASAGPLASIDANVQVTYVGRALAPGAKYPRVKYVPWAASYEHQLADAYSRTGALGQNPFMNPFTYPLTVHRLVGKPADAAPSGVGNFIVGATSMLPLASILSARKWVSIYIDDSQGYKVTRTFSSVGSVFDTMRQSWTFNRQLGGRQQLDMQFQTNGTTVAGGTVPVFNVALLGYREEAA